VKNSHRGVLPERYRVFAVDSAGLREPDRHRRRRLAVAAVGFCGEWVIAGPEVLEGIVILHARFIVHGGQECPIAADVVDPSRVPDLPNGVIGEQIRQQLNMIPMGMTQDHVVDRGQRRSGGLHERQHAVVRSAGQVVVGSGVVDEREVRPPHEDR